MVIKNLKRNLIGVGIVWIHNMNVYTHSITFCCSSYSLYIKKLTLWMSRTVAGSVPKMVVFF